jgi:hypothetical protein
MTGMKRRRRRRRRRRTIMPNLVAIFLHKIMNLPPGTMGD